MRTKNAAFDITARSKPLKSGELYDPKKSRTYRRPIVDIDEWRERELSDGTKARYRYVHGYFKNTALKFAFYFPEKRKYKGRFFQRLSPFPGPDEENAALARKGEDDEIAFAILHGAYYVECNMGSGMVFTGLLEVYQTNSAVAEFSRKLAKRMYGGKRAYGYVYGGSGGGYKTIACIENTKTWDGAVPYVIGSPMAIPSCITNRARAMRILRNKYKELYDTIDAGGSGDPCSVLSDEEAQAYLEATALGLPPGTWFLTANGFINDGSLPVLAPGVKMGDPQYFEDFWNKPGYEGFDASVSAARDRLQFTSKLRAAYIPGENGKPVVTGSVDDAWQKALVDGGKAYIELEETPDGENLYLCGVVISFESGDAMGKRLLLDSIKDGKLYIGMCYGVDSIESVISLLKPGDTVRLDNSDYIAIQSYQRHIVPEDRSFIPWEQYRSADGKPLYPQRFETLGRPVFFDNGTGTVQEGHIHGKVIVIDALMDESAYPWQANWYRSKVIESKGNEDDFRLWYMQNCLHGDFDGLECNYCTNYMGALHQALLELSDWAERGVVPPSTTSYRIEDAQVIVPEGARERKGIQPVVRLSANGGKRASAKPGEAVRLRVEVELPCGGAVTSIKLSRDDGDKARRSFERLQTGERTDCFEEELAFELSENGAFAEAAVSYEQPGVYFVSVLVKYNRCGDPSDIFTQIKNIDRSRIIIKE